MEIGVYLFISGLLWVLGLIFVPRLRQRVGLYLALGAMLPPLALALYLLLPARVGIYSSTVVRPDPSTNGRPGNEPKKLRI